MRLRSTLLMLLLGFAVGAIVFFLAKGGLLGLPTSPYGDKEERISLLDEVSRAERRIARRIPELRASDPLNLRLHESDLRDLAIAGLARHPEGRRVLELAHQLNAEIGGGEVGFELMVNLASIPRHRLTEKELETVEKIEDLLPVLGRSDLPIGLYGSPEASRGRIRLGGTPWMKVSILRLSLGTVSERLGISEQDLERSLEIEWPGFEVLDVTVEENAIELVVTRSA